MFGCRANALHCHGAVMQIHGLHLGFNGHCMFSFRPLSFSFFSSLYLCNAAVCGICTCSWGAKCGIYICVPLLPFYDSLSFFSCPFLKKRFKHILALSLCSDFLHLFATTLMLFSLLALAFVSFMPLVFTFFLALPFVFVFRTAPFCLLRWGRCVIFIKTLLCYLNGLFHF